MAVSTTPTEVQQIAAEAFTYLYPLVTMDVTRAQLTDDSGKVGHGKPNTFVHVAAFPTADFREVVRPNFDTLYSSAWLDLTDGPLVVHVPDSDGRYYLLPMLDMWTDVFTAPGKRTTGTRAQDLLVVPPGWTGEGPAGMARVDAPTPYVWVIGRTQTNGPEDYDAVHGFQAGFTIERLGGGAPSTDRDISDVPSGVDLSDEPLRIVNTMPAADFFAYAARLLKRHPTHLTDGSIIARLTRIGLVRGEDFDASMLDAEQAAALQAGASAALASFPKLLPALGKVTNGWVLYTDGIGVYGNFYLKRAITTQIGLGANPPEDAIYPVSVADSTGKPLVGETGYVLHFEKSQLPPVDAFWSVTMYDQEGFQVANELDRFAIGDRDDLRYNDDGSLDLFLQHENPGTDKVSNWLPAPLGPLGVTMRLYAPQPQALTGEWTPPAVTPA
jgi:hypothetical protein